MSAHPAETGPQQCDWLHAQLVLQRMDCQIHSLQTKMSMMSRVMDIYIHICTLISNKETQELPGNLFHSQIIVYYLNIVYTPFHGCGQGTWTKMRYWDEQHGLHLFTS